ncbi:alpha/beta hydrolase family protein, partial [Jiangella muralis]|uniref:alpha/beta hydrolase family protein n=1 Tax=Jiangella muralis TaxID=702383 RepID=UPI001969F57C
MRDPREVLTRAAPPPRWTVAYGDRPDQVIDVWPADRDGARPLVVVVHGGFWRAEYDRRHTWPECAGFVAAGYAVAAIEYRRTGAGGGWPATFDDVAAALDAAPLLAAEVTDVDPGRVVHVGHSAGAHLAVWAASRGRLPAGARWAAPAPEARPAGVVSLAGVLDLRAAAGLRLDGGAADELLGGGPGERPERYAVTDPLTLAPPGRPVALLHGTEDRQGPPP